MFSRRFPFVIVTIGSVCGLALLGLAASASGQQMPVHPSPPQQMPASVAPTTTYPSTNTNAYPSTNVGTYPSTSPSAAGARSSYDDPLPGISVGGAVQASYEENYEEAGPLYEPYGSPEAMTSAAAQAMETNAYVDRGLICGEPWTWQVVPAGLMYRSYLAGNREPRISCQWVRMRDEAWLWDATVGGRVGLLRYGTTSAIWPEGWQFDVEGAAFPRMDLENERDMVSCDFRAGGLLTTRQGCWEAKFGYYHLSSHIGDEYLIRHPTFNRLNYVRDSLVLGMAIYPLSSMRVYSEAGWAFNTDGGAKPWEFQFGIDWSSLEPSNRWGDPFFAINGHLREENDYGGNMTVQTGWQWRGCTGHLLRVGMQYFNGFSDQYQFYNVFEEQLGFGLWYDY